MLTEKIIWLVRWRFAGLAAALLLVNVCCSRSATTAGVKKIPAGQEYAGFLTTYANLKSHPDIENTRYYVTDEPAKNIHHYVAVIIDTPAVYVATNADQSAISERGVAALREYFQDKVTDALSDAFPVVQSSGPLVLRLRSAIVGVDVGRQTGSGERNADTLDRAMDIGKVGVEMELVDSETGAQIAAAVDRQNLGEGAEIASAHFSREEKFRAATQAFDGWAARIRQFVDSASELSEADVRRIEKINSPYSDPGTPIH